MARHLSREEVKAAKEAFVSGLTGTSPQEVLSTLLVGPACIVLVRLLSIEATRQWRSWSPWPLFVLEAVALLLPTVLSLVVPEWTPALVMVILVCCGALKVYKRVKRPQHVATLFSNSLHDSGQDVNPLVARETRLPFVTHYRGGMLLITVVCILAVDFVTFPRRLAKCETFGFSIMDAGVGSFIFSAGLVSQQARAPSRAVRRGAYYLYASARTALPALVLGMMRLLAHRSVDYQLHVTEYGVHWNFFFTLAAVALLSAAVHALLATCFPDAIPGGVYGAGALVLAGGYQMLLRRGLQDVLLSDDRTSFLLQNKEGLAGLFGFLALHMAGVCCGRFVYAAFRNERRGTTGTVGVTATLFAVGSACCICVVAGGWHVSRRLTNAPYVLWIVGYNTLQLAALRLVDSTAVIPAGSKAQRVVSVVLAGLNHNGLPLFMLANLLTGAINLWTDTIFRSWWFGFAVISVYTAVVAGAGIACSTVALLKWKRG